MCQSHLSFGVTRSQTSRYFVDLMFSLHVTNRSLCVDALIGGNYVATMLVTINGHLKVLKSLSITVREYHHMTSLFLSVCLSVCLLPLFLSFVKEQCPQSYASTVYICILMGTRGQVAILHQHSSSYSSIVRLMKGYQAERLLKHSGEKAKSEK